MARPQNSAKGLFAKDRIDVGSNQLTYNTTALLLSAGIRLSAKANATITGDSTGIVLAGGVKVSSKANAVITGDSTGVVLNAGVKISNKANAVVTGDSTGIVVVGGVKPSNKANAVITGDSTGAVIVGGVKISNARAITANSTGFIVPSEATLPTTDEGVAFTMGSDGTGVFMAICATGVTWKYLRATSVRADAS